MNHFSELLEEIRSLLREIPSFANVQVTSSFPSHPKPHPLQKAYAAVGIQQVEGGSLGLGDFLGEQSSSPDGSPDLYGKKLTVTVSLLLCVPPKDGGDRCRLLQEDILNRLFLEETCFSVLSFHSGEIRYDSSLCAMTLRSEITLSLVFSRSKQELFLRDFYVRSELV